MKISKLWIIAIWIFCSIPVFSQDKISIESNNQDVSDNLDLKAVASVFGDSKDLEEFEQKLNDPDSGLSNLDLNNDGEVDYLRVVETNENDEHLVVIQAVLEKDIFQDVATISVQRSKKNKKTVVQVVGASYIYGENYIIEPVYVYTPPIYTYFWSVSYRPWVSPYYWGYYPQYYHCHRPYEISLYRTRVHRHVNVNYRYYYTDRIRCSSYDRYYKSVCRNDYYTRYPERSFSSRNANVRNRQEYDTKYNRTSVAARPQVSRDTRSNNGRYGQGDASSNRSYTGRSNSTNSSNSQASSRSNTSRRESPSTYNRGSNPSTSTGSSSRTPSMSSPSSSKKYEGSKSRGSNSSMSPSRAGSSSQQSRSSRSNGEGRR